MKDEVGFDQNPRAARDHPSERPSLFFRPPQLFRHSPHSLSDLVSRSGLIRVSRGGKRCQRHTRVEDRGSRIEDRVNCRSSVFVARSSILDPRSSILNPRSRHRDSPFVSITSLTTGRHLLALVRGTCSTSSILTSRPGRLAVTMFSICRRLSSPNPFFGAIMKWTE